MKQSMTVGNINERDISFDLVAGLAFLPQSRVDNIEYSFSFSKHSHLNTLRTSELTKCDTRRISTVQNRNLDVLGLEKIDCGYDVIQPSAENSSDNFLGLLKEYNMNITPFSCDNGKPH